SVLWHVLRHAGASVTTYVPHRLDEGYGLNDEAIRTLCAPGSDNPDCRPLIVSVDCGSTACGPARVAKDLGAALILTDPHQFDPAALPEAYALVHPGLPGEETGEEGREKREEGNGSALPSSLFSLRSSLHHLCGAGVAFKLAWQVAKEHCGTEKLPE